ncbi:MAG: TldD/PmbA family protein [Chloroflexi bacterium]|nr:TldD/PmbA family protein [Chloroflexota bacterium]
MEEEARREQSANAEAPEAAPERDEYCQLTADFAQIVRRAKESYQEKAPGREIDFVGLYMGSRSGIVCKADERGIPQVTVSGEEEDNQGNRRTQRFFIGLQAEVGTKDTEFQSANLAERETIVKEFEVTSQGHELVKAAIEGAQRSGERVQRRVDEENYEWFPIVHVDGAEHSINEDVYPRLELDEIVALVAGARQVVRQALGAKLDRVEVVFLKWREHTEYADTDLMKVDQIVPRLGITISVRTKDGSEAFGAIRGAMGGMEVLRRFEPARAQQRSYLEIVQELAKGVAKEAIDLDRAQGAAILGTECPVILSPAAAGVLAHEVFGHTSEGDIICQNRRSKTAQLTLKSRIGAQVSDNPAFSMIDSGAATIKLGRKALEHAFGAIVVDDHGCPGKETRLVDRGIQVNVLNDRYTLNEIMDGLKDDIVEGMRAHGLTGNVRREKYDMPPQVRMTNTYIMPDEKGPKSLAEMATLVPKNRRGVYIKSCQGGWVNPDGGEFVLNGNLCYLIENGTVTDKPIKGVKVTGNVAKFVDCIRAIGAAETMDQTFTGYCGKNDQWVPVEGGGPLLYIEDAKLAGGAAADVRRWSELVVEYDKQHAQASEGKRSPRSIYLPEMGEVLGKETSQAKVCLVTAALRVEEEVDLVMGRRDRAQFAARDGKMVRRSDRFE